MIRSRRTARLLRLMTVALVSSVGVLATTGDATASPVSSASALAVFVDTPAVGTVPPQPNAGPSIAPTTTTTTTPTPTCAATPAGLAQAAPYDAEVGMCIDAAAPGGHETSFSDAKPGTSQTTAGAPDWCTYQWMGFRDQACVKFDSTLRIYDPRTGATQGTMDFTVTQTMALRFNSTSFDEQFWVTVTDFSGPLLPITMSIVAFCDACETTSEFMFQPIGPLIDATAPIHYTVSVGQGEKYTRTPLYAMQFYGPGGPGTMVTWEGTSFRCDDTFRNTNAGCVFDWYTPTMTSLGRLPYISQGIARIQAAGGYGVYGGTKLTRAADEATQTRNRQASCPDSLRPPPGTPTNLDSCDEYPFASTNEGGASVKPPSSGITWVPLSENRSQAGLITSFYSHERVLDGEGFWVMV